MDTHELGAEQRLSTGKGGAHKTRARGLVPAVVYGKGMDPMSIACQPVALRDMLKSQRGRNTVIKLNIEGQDNILAMLQDVQIHPLSRQILHSDFVRILEDQKVLVRVPIRLVGRPEGVKMGGLLQPVRRAVSVRCLPRDIPVEVVVDVTALNVGESILIKNVVPPEGTEIVYRTNFAVATVLK